MITIILILLIVVILSIMWCKSKEIKETTKNEKLINISDIHNKKDIQMAPQINPNFIEAMFHSDYMDVITSFNNLSPNQRQIFNINNIPCEVTKDIDDEIVGDIAKDFIQSLNDDISKNIPLTHTANSGWDEALPEETCESGWEKVQRQLGLPTSLFNKPKMKTNIELVNVSHIIKYETENEIKYECQIVIAKNKVSDKLIIKLSVVVPKGILKDGVNVIVENISVIGYLTKQGLGTDRVATDDFYYFDNLEQNNMITGKTVATEMMKKYDMKRKIMQERIDGMDVDTQEKYKNSPTPSDYDTYQFTQTVFDDMFGEKKFD